MLKTSQNWIKELSDIITPCTDLVQSNSSEYDFYEIKGFDPDRIRLAIYNLNHTDCWEIAFQQRKDVWHACGSFPNRNDFYEQFGDNVENGWRNDIEVLKHGFETPVDWIRSFVK